MKPIFAGTVRPGLGTGASYVSMQHFHTFFVKFLGNAPFPGTLNVQLSSDSVHPFFIAIEHVEPRIIPAETINGQDHWRVACYPVSIWKPHPRTRREVGKEGGLALSFDNPAHPRDVVEIVSAIHLRARFKLVDGDPVTFTLEGLEG